MPDFRHSWSVSVFVTFTLKSLTAGREGDQNNVLLSEVPKRVVSKRAVLADVPLPVPTFFFLLFDSFTFWQFGAVSLPKKGDPDHVFSLN